MFKDADFYLNNATEFDALTPDQQSLVLSGGSLPIGEPESAPAVVNPEPTASTATEVEEPPVVMGKSGKHIIPYEVLEDTRSENAQLRQRLAELEASLQTAKADDAGTGSTAAQDAVIAEFKGEYEGLFPEVAEDLKPLIQAMVAAGVTEALAKIESRVAPVEQQFARQSQQDADNTILGAHPDIVERMNDVGWTDWVKNNPYILDSATKQPLHVETVLDQGTPREVIELFNQYKTASSGQSAPAAKVDPTAIAKAKAAEVLKNMKPGTPGTLSDIQTGGQMAKHNDVERFLAMSDQELETAFLTMTEAQREAVFAKL